MTDEQAKLLYTLVQKVDDFKSDSEAWQKEHDRKSEEWRKSIDERFIPLEELAKQARWSWKILMGFGIAVGGTVKALFWVRDQIRP